MAGNGQHENGRYKQDNRAPNNNQWLIPPLLLKDEHALMRKFLGVIRERDAAIEEKEFALSEKETAVIERDMAIMQRDQAVAELKNALMERDNALAAITAFEYRDGSAASGANGSSPQEQHETTEMNPNIHFLKELPLSSVAVEPLNPRRARRAKKDIRDQDLRVSRSSSSEPEFSDLFSQVRYDKTSIPTPGCSCTGAFQQCYKWGKGGWQSSCCTTTLSIHPLPLIPHKRPARMGGRKMSASVFSKLFNKLAQDGYDLSIPVDLKDYWSKHGTNRYITIR